MDAISPASTRLCRSRTRKPVDPRDNGPMGFNPNRPHRRTNADYAIVLAAFIFMIALVTWGLGGL